MDSYLINNVSYNYEIILELYNINVKWKLIEIK